MKGELMKHKLVRLFLAAVLLAVFAPSMVLADYVTEGSGTNAVNTLGANVQYGGSVMQPIMLGLIGLFGAVGLYYRFAGKARVRS